MADLIAGGRLQLGISRGSPEQVIDGWRYFGYQPGDNETDADMARRHTAALLDVLRGEGFAQPNPRPMFHSGPVALARGPRVMKSRHLSMSIRQDTRVFRAVAWRMAERAEFVTQHGDALDVAFNLTENHYRGEHTIELSVADIREAR